MAKILVAGFQHETNTFSPLSTTLDDFLIADNWPGLVTGDLVRSGCVGKGIPIAGFIAQAEALGHQCVPLLWCSATPSGVVTAEAYNVITDQILSAVQSHLADADAVYLDLHGAMVSEVARDADGHLLQRIRELIGDQRWLLASLDCHANVSPAMVEQADLLVSYRTYPHIDMAATGKRAASVFDAYWQRSSKPKKMVACFDFLIPLLAGCGLIEPAKTIFHALNIDQGEPLLTLSFNLGFSLADTKHTRPSLLVYADNVHRAQSLLSEISGLVRTHQGAFKNDFYSPQQAISWVLDHAKPGLPVIFADTQDNPGGGGSGDTMGITRALLANSALSSALVATLYDPRAAETAFNAGEGAWVDLQLGEWQGATNEAPLQVRAQVIACSDQPVLATGPFYAGCEIDLGKMVRLKIQHIEAIVVSRKVQAADQAILTHLGAIPMEYGVLVLKSSVHFRADFQSLAQRVLVVQSPGLNRAELSGLSFQYLAKEVTF